MTEPEEPQDREWLAGMVAAFLCGARGMTQLKPLVTCNGYTITDVLNGVTPS